jgi:hypothetical protein
MSLEIDLQCNFAQIEETYISSVADLDSGAANSTSIAVQRSSDDCELNISGVHSIWRG